MHGVPVKEIAKSGVRPSVTLGFENLGSRAANMAIMGMTTDEIRDLAKLKKQNRFFKKEMPLAKMAKEFRSMELVQNSRLGKLAKEKGVILSARDTPAAKVAKAIPAEGTGVKGLVSGMGDAFKGVTKTAENAAPLASVARDYNVSRILSEVTPDEMKKITEVISDLGYDVEKAPKTGGGVLKKKPPKSMLKRGARLVGSNLPYVGAVFDAVEAGQDFQEDGIGSSEAWAHVGDAALGLSGIGEIANIGAVVATAALFEGSEDTASGAVSLLEDAITGD